MPVPDLYRNAPTMQWGTEIFFTAFTELSAERETAPGSIFPIKARDIRDWAIRAGYGDDLDFVDELTSHVKACDAVWRRVEAERIQKAQADAQREEARARSKANG
jgi:hypothetical protein